MWHPVYDEMKKESEGKQMEDFKVRCVESKDFNITLGKIYEVRNGKLLDDKQILRPDNDKILASIDDIHNYYGDGQTAYEWIGQFELVTESTFTKADLRTGMRVETREGDIYIVFLGTEDGDIIQGDWWNSLEHYNNDLTVNRESRLDIVKVYSKHMNNSLTDVTRVGALLWQRTEPLKMTHKQIEKMIGHEFEYVKECGNECF